MDLSFKKTRSSLMWTSLLQEPLISLYAYLPFLLRKDLHASAMQIFIFISLRPLMTLFSFYWSHGKEENIKRHLILSSILARLPFLLFFFLDNVWYLLLASALHIFFSKGGLPSWMEILKRNIPASSREKLFSISSMLGYLEGILLALAFGALLDLHSDLWKFFYLFAAIVGMCIVFFQAKLPIYEKATLSEKKSYKERLISPWNTVYTLMKNRKDFAHFQWSFMIGGLGIMMTATILPFFFVDTLLLSHVHFTTARTICMGLGFLLSSPLWARSLSSLTIGPLTSLICLGFGLFSLSLIFSSWNIAFLYLAYIIYGISQGGSHLIWHLSGPLFSGGEDSAKYSEVNIVMVGLRGIISPLLGTTLLLVFSPETALSISLFLCLSGAIYSHFFAPEPEKESVS